MGIHFNKEFIEEALDYDDTTSKVTIKSDGSLTLRLLFSLKLSFLSEGKEVATWDAPIDFKLKIGLIDHKLPQF